MITKINDSQVEGIAKCFEENPDATMSLEDLCDILKISLKHDNEVIFEILADDIFFLNTNHSQFAWTTNKQGFEILRQYAYHKQRYLQIFHELFMSDFRNKKIKKQEQTQHQKQEDNHDH
ncbi:MAG: hypothetical protein IJ730_04795 [Alphaproteobacteria bacterium]|nr:hypothetical protein [Alphaproteobacteria bacterium]MBR2137542.1 hypothetical protein [Alphaproteobacteria bacterium]